MALGSLLPTNVTPGLRLKEYLALVREMSRQSNPRDLVRVFRARAGFVVPHDQNLTVTRLNAAPCEVRLLASSVAGVEYDPWSHPDDPPRLRSDFMCRLMDSDHAIKIDQIELEPGDPIAPYMEGMNSLAAVPIFRGGRPLHMVILLRGQSRTFTLEELSTLLLTSNLVGQASAHSELAEQVQTAYTALDREFRAVGAIQRELLPLEVPRIPGVSVATHYETSTRAGGDYYDFFPLPSGDWGFFIADVSGHGVPAAVVTARIQALLHAPLTACPVVETAPQRVLQGLNQCLVSSMRSGNFVTALYGVFTPSTRTFRYAMAGHNPPRWLRRRRGDVTALEMTEGLPLGILDPVLMTENEVCFEAGDRLLLYTDGITETFGPSRELFGTERLDAALRRGHKTAHGIVEAVLKDVRDFSEGAPPADDRTLVAIAFD